MKPRPQNAKRAEDPVRGRRASKPNEDQVGKLAGQEMRLRSWLSQQLVATDTHRMFDLPKDTTWIGDTIPLSAEDHTLLDEIMAFHRQDPGGDLCSTVPWPINPPPERFGRLGDTPAAKFVYYLQSVFQVGGSTDPYGDELHQSNSLFVDWVSVRVVMRNADFFRQVAEMLELEAKGILALAAPADLGLKDTPGRKLKPYDLEIAFPIAAVHLLDYRVRPSLPELPPAPRPWYICRDEIHDELQHIREQMGFIPEEGPPYRVSDSHLSRFLNKSGLVRFVR